MARSNWTWAYLGLLAFGLRLLAGFFPELTDHYYSRTIFLVVRKGFDFSLGRFPFPSVYLFISLLFGLLIFFIYRLFWVVDPRKRITYLIQAIANGGGALVFFFLLLWGYNYQRTPIFKQLDLQLQGLSIEQLIQEMEQTKHLAASARAQISQDTMALTAWMKDVELEALVRKVMREKLGEVGLNISGHPRAKPFPPNGFMRSMGILGIYFPYVGESYFDPSLHTLEKPFTIAHEMMHSLGVTDEGEANFIAWVICTKAEEALLRYSAHLILLRYQLRDYHAIDPDGAFCWMETLPRGIVQDLIAIRKSAEAYPPIWLEFSRKSNDLFLKSQGVKSGIQSYQKFPMLAAAWRRKGMRQ